MKSNEVNMLSGSITKGLLIITIPIMVMNVLLNMFSVIDMTVLGILVDDNAVGAVGACGSLITLINSLVLGVSVGANVIVANYIGKGDPDKIEKAVGASIFVAILGGLILLILGVSCAEIFLRWTNCDESLIPQAVKYFKIYFLGSPIIMLYAFCAAILRASGDTKRPMYFLTIGGILKIFANVFFIKVFNFTVEGVALATIICQGVAGGACLYILIKNNGSVKFKFKNFGFHFNEIKQMLFIGIPSGVQTAVYSFANVVIAATVNAIGPEATKGMSIANQFDGIIYQIAIAPALAGMAYVSQNVGVGNIKRVKQTIIRATGIAIAFGGFFGALSAIFSSALASIMSRDPLVIQYAQQKMVIVSSLYFVCGINEVLSCALKGMKRPIIPTISSIIFMCLIRFPWVYYVYPFVPNLSFLYLVWPIGWILSIITLLLFLCPTIKKFKKKNELENTAPQNEDL